MGMVSEPLAMKRFRIIAQIELTDMSVASLVYAATDLRNANTLIGLCCESRSLGGRCPVALIPAIHVPVDENG